MLCLTRRLDIAFSAAKIQTREVRGANFQYSKLLGLPYLGAGMVDLPPHGSKRSKNSRKMHMVFCVLTGKVNATVGETVFSISKGGVWMVPRGKQSFRLVLTTYFASVIRSFPSVSSPPSLPHHRQRFCIAGPDRRTANANPESVCKTTYV